MSDPNDDLPWAGVEMESGDWRPIDQVPHNCDTPPLCADCGHPLENCQCEGQDDEEET